jgi:PAS domain-containing protein
MSRRPKKKAAETTPHYTSEELYQTLFEQATDGIFIADAQGHFVEVNRRGCEMLGYTREEMLDLSIEELIPIEELVSDYTREEFLSFTVYEIDPLATEPSGQKALEEFLRTGSQVRESQHRRKDSSILPVEINVNYSYIPPMNLKASALAWPPYAALSTGIAAEYGRKEKLTKGPPFTFRYLNAIKQQ